jgi:hypothetical protein
MNIIIFSGKSKSGKTTCVKLLRLLYPNKNIYEYNFGDELKNICLKNINNQQKHKQFSINDFYNTNEKEKIYKNMISNEDFSLRGFLQQTADKYKKTNGDDFFAKIVVNKIKCNYYNKNNESNEATITNKEPIIVGIGDARYEYEIQCIKDNFKDAKIIIIKLNRDENNTQEPANIHSSEIINIKYNYLIYNNNTIDNLKSKINDILS